MEVPQDELKLVPFTVVSIGSGVIVWLILVNEGYGPLLWGNNRDIIRQS